MPERLGLTAEKLRALPLMHGLSDEHIGAIAKLFEPVDAKPGDALFDVDQPAFAIYLLVKGDLTLEQPDNETYVLHPPCIIGELGALTQLTRNSRAVVGANAELYEVTRDKLLGYFETAKQVGLAFEKNLLDICADKIDRDQRRLQDMRESIIRTQKAMKNMRELIEESTDTDISGPLHETIEALIKRNRRVNYRVTPPVTAVSSIKMDGGAEAPIVQISRTHLSFRPSAGAAPETGARFSGVLRLSGPEIPISGVVLRIYNGRVDLELDLLMDEYTATLEGYLTRVQMLDFLV